MQKIYSGNSSSDARARSISGENGELSAKYSHSERPTLGSAASMNVRESIITSSQEQLRNKTTCIEDWSFLDESILRAVANDVTATTSNRKQGIKDYTTDTA